MFWRKRKIENNKAQVQDDSSDEMPITRLSSGPYEANITLSDVMVMSTIMSFLTLSRRFPELVALKASVATLVYIKAAQGKDKDQADEAVSQALVWEKAIMNSSLDNAKTLLGYQRECGSRIYDLISVSFSI